MSVVKKSLPVLSVLFSVLMISFLGKQAIVNWQRNRLIPEPDGYAVLQEESTPRSELGEKDWIAADRKLFVLLEEAAQVNVYDPDGRFLYAIRFAHGPNGKAEIGYRNGQLMIATRTAYIHVFEGERQVACYPPTMDEKNERLPEYRELSSFIRLVHSDSTEQERGFARKGNRLYRVDGTDAPKCIVSIPDSHTSLHFWSSVSLGVIRVILGAVQFCAKQRENSLPVCKDRERTNGEKGLRILPYRVKLMPNCSEEALLERVGFRARNLGYSKPVIRETKAGERELYLKPEAFSRAGVCISMNLSELKNTGELPVCCRHPLYFTIFWLVFGAALLAFNVLAVVGTAADWKPTNLILYAVLLVFDAAWVFMYRYPLRREGNAVIGSLLSDSKSPF